MSVQLKRPRIRRPVGRPSMEQKIMEATLLSSAIDYQQWLSLNNRIATGNAINSFVVVIKKKANNLILEGELKAISYMNHVLFGRAPGKAPNRAVILQWMRSKGVKSELYSDRDLSYLIARKIGEQGTLPPHLDRNIRARMVKLNTTSVIRKARKAYAKEKSTEFMNELRNEFKLSNARSKNVTMRVIGGKTRIKEVRLNSLIDTKYDL